MQNILGKILQRGRSQSGARPGNPGDTVSDTELYTDRSNSLIPDSQRNHRGVGDSQTRSKKAFVWLKTNKERQRAISGEVGSLPNKARLLPTHADVEDFVKSPVVPVTTVHSKPLVTSKSMDAEVVENGRRSPQDNVSLTYSMMTESEHHFNHNGYNNHGLQFIDLVSDDQQPPEAKKHQPTWPQRNYPPVTSNSYSGIGTDSTGWHSVNNINSNCHQHTNNISSSSSSNGVTVRRSAFSPSPSSFINNNGHCTTIANGTSHLAGVYPKPLPANVGDHFYYNNKPYPHYEPPTELSMAEANQSSAANMTLPARFKKRSEQQSHGQHSHSHYRSVSQQRALGAADNSVVTANTGAYYPMSASVAPPARSRSAVPPAPQMGFSISPVVLDPAQRNRQTDTTAVHFAGKINVREQQMEEDSIKPPPRPSSMVDNSTRYSPAVMDNSFDAPENRPVSSASIHRPHQSQAAPSRCLVYLVYRGETRRALLPLPLSLTGDLLLAYFYQSFPSLARSRARLVAPAFLILDPRSTIYQQLVDMRQIMDRCVIKLVDQQQNLSMSSSAHQFSGPVQAQQTGNLRLISATSAATQASAAAPQESYVARSSSFSDFANQNGDVCRTMPVNSGPLLVPATSVGQPQSAGNDGTLRRQQQQVNWNDSLGRPAPPRNSGAFGPSSATLNQRKVTPHTGGTVSDVGEQEDSAGTANTAAVDIDTKIRIDRMEVQLASLRSLLQNALVDETSNNRQTTPAGPSATNTISRTVKFKKQEGEGEYDRLDDNEAPGGGAAEGGDEVTGEPTKKNQSAVQLSSDLSSIKAELGQVRQQASLNESTSKELAENFAKAIKERVDTLLHSNRCKLEEQRKLLAGLCSTQAKLIEIANVHVSSATKKEQLRQSEGESETTYSCTADELISCVLSPNLEQFRSVAMSLQQCFHNVDDMLLDCGGGDGSGKESSQDALRAIWLRVDQLSADVDNLRELVAQGFSIQSASASNTVSNNHSHNGIEKKKTHGQKSRSKKQKSVETTSDHVFEDESGRTEEAHCEPEYKDSPNGIVQAEEVAANKSSDAIQEDLSVTSLNGKLRLPTIEPQGKMAIMSPRLAEKSSHKTNGVAGGERTSSYTKNPYTISNGQHKKYYQTQKQILAPPPPPFADGAGKEFSFEDESDGALPTEDVSSHFGYGSGLPLRVDGSLSAATATASMIHSSSKKKTVESQSTTIDRTERYDNVPSGGEATDAFPEIATLSPVQKTINSELTQSQVDQAASQIQQYRPMPASLAEAEEPPPVDEIGDPPPMSPQVQKQAAVAQHTEQTVYNSDGSLNRSRSRASKSTSRSPPLVSHQECTEVDSVVWYSKHARNPASYSSHNSPRPNSDDYSAKKVPVAAAGHARSCNTLGADEATKSQVTAALKTNAASAPSVHPSPSTGPARQVATVVVEKYWSDSKSAENGLQQLDSSKKQTLSNSDPYVRHQKQPPSMPEAEHVTRKVEAMNQATGGHDTKSSEASDDGAYNVVAYV